MPTHSPQADFPTLVVPHTTQHEQMDDVVFNEIFAEGQGRSSKEELTRILSQSDDAGASITTDDAVVSMTNDDMLSACAFAAASRFGHQSGMDLDSPLPATDQSIYDPTRPVPCFAPPKRYFRTFWVSAARRLLQIEVDVSNC